MNNQLELFLKKYPSTEVKILENELLYNSPRHLEKEVKDARILISELSYTDLYVRQNDETSPGTFSVLYREKKDTNNVNHPKHYGGENNTYETIKVIEAWELDFCLGNAVKYISRAGKKRSNSKLQDLEKAKWYLEQKISQLKT